MPKPQGGARELPKLIVQLLTKIRIAAAQDVTQFRRTEKPIDLPKNELDRNAKMNQVILGMGAYEVTNEPNKDFTTCKSWRSANTYDYLRYFRSILGGFSE